MAYFAFQLALCQGNWLAQLASKKTQRKRPAKCPTDLIKVQKTIGQLVLKTLNVLTDPNNTQDVGKVIEAFAKTLAIEDNQRLLNGEKCGLPGWRVIKLGCGQQSLMFYHPSGLRIKNSWNEVLNFMDRCEQTSLASATAHVFGLPDDWGAIKRDASVVNGQFKWKYISPQGVEYFKLNGKGGALEASKMPITTVIVDTSVDATAPAAATKARAVTPDMFADVLAGLQANNKRLSECVTNLSNKIQKLETIVGEYGK